MSHINAQQAELNNAQQVFTSLRGKFDAAEQVAKNEYSQNHLIRDQAVAEVASRRATSKQNERDWKAKAETRHAEIVTDMRMQVNSTAHALAESLQKILLLGGIVKERDESLRQAESNLERLRRSSELMSKELTINKISFTN